MAKEYTFEEIESYLAGEMNVADRKQFELVLAEDTSLADRLKSQQEAHALVDLYARSNIKDKVKSIYDANQLNTSGHSSGFSVMKIAATVVILIIAGALYFYIGSGYDPAYLADQAFEPYPNMFRTLGDSDDNDFTKGLNAYDESDYQEAITQFSKIKPGNEKYVDAQFYLGVSNLGSAQYQAALEPLKFVISSASLYEGSASWYLCLVYLQLEKEQEAKEILKTIAAKGGKKSKVAQELLEKLDSKFRDLPFTK